MRLPDDITEITIATQDTDVEAGYADYSETVDRLEELSGAAREAENYGVPAHRLTVTVYYSTQMGVMHDVLGTLEEVMAELKTKEKGKE